MAYLLSRTVVQLEFDFNNRNVKDDRTVIRVGDIKPLSR